MFRYPPSVAQPGGRLPERFLLPAIRSHQDQTIERADPALGRVMYSVAPLDRSMGHGSSLILALPISASLALADRWLAAELAAMALAGILSLVVATTALYRFTLHPLGRLLETTAHSSSGRERSTFRFGLLMADVSFRGAPIVRALPPRRVGLANGNGSSRRTIFASAAGTRAAPDGSR